MTRAGAACFFCATSLQDAKKTSLPCRRVVLIRFRRCGGPALRKLSANAMGRENSDLLVRRGESIVHLRGGRAARPSVASPRVKVERRGPESERIGNLQTTCFILVYIKEGTYLPFALARRHQRQCAFNRAETLAENALSLRCETPLPTIRQFAF